MCVSGSLLTGFVFWGYRVKQIAVGLWREPGAIGANAARSVVSHPPWSDPLWFRHKKRKNRASGYPVSVCSAETTLGGRGAVNLTRGAASRPPRIKSNSGKIHIEPRQSPRHPWKVAGWRRGEPPTLFCKSG